MTNSRLSLFVWRLPVWLRLRRVVCVGRGFLSTVRQCCWESLPFRSVQKTKTILFLSKQCCNTVTELRRYRGQSILYTLCRSQTMLLIAETEVDQTRFANWIVSRERSLETLSLLFDCCWPLVPLTTSAHETFSRTDVRSSFTALPGTGPSVPLPLDRISPTPWDITAD